MANGIGKLVRYPCMTSCMKITGILLLLSSICSSCIFNISPPYIKFKMEPFSFMFSSVIPRFSNTPVIPALESFLIQTAFNCVNCLAFSKTDIPCIISSIVFLFSILYLSYILRFFLFHSIFSIKNLPTSHIYPLPSKKHV